MTITVEFFAPPGQSLTLLLCSHGTYTPANGVGDGATETARAGVYTATVAETLSGWHTAHIVLGSVELPIGDVYLVDGETCRVLDHDARLSTEIDGLSVDIAALEVVPLAAVGPAPQAGEITIHRGDTFTLTLSNLAAAARTKAWFTLKEFEDNTDAESLIQITEAGGLVYLDGEAATDPALGSIVFNEAGTSAVVTIRGAATAVLAATAIKGLRRGRRYDFQVLMAAGPVTKISGVAYVTGDVTRAVS
jgi:hypothetical protein